jgi:hypothetical protein
VHAGITGGFAPPTPTAVHQLALSREQPALVQITSSLRPHGTPTLQDAMPKTLAADAADPLVDELHALLKDLPTEQPPGSQDIYGLDTSIMFGMDGFEWCNGGPAGCGGGESMVQVNDAQKKQFKRAVEIVNELVQKAG